jgi:hypothetical protein
MLAPTRLLELIRDPRVIVVAVANATTALMTGLSATNRNLSSYYFLKLSKIEISENFEKSSNRG